MQDNLTDAVDALRARLDALLAAPVLGDPDDRARPVAAATGIRDSAEVVVAAAVRQARRDGASWQTIGDALGVTRQAAFQRYGKPIDPRTGEPVNSAALPEATTLAAEVIDELAAGEWARVRTRFDATVTEHLPEDALATAWAYVVAQSGEYERHGDPEAVRAAEMTVTNTPLVFEAGDFTARITFRDDRTIAGLYILESKNA